jgi:hypothetical protein
VLAGDEHVFQHADAREDPSELKGAADAEAKTLSDEPR